MLSKENDCLFRFTKNVQIFYIRLKTRKKTLVRFFLPHNFDKDLREAKKITAYMGQHSSEKYFQLDNDTTSFKSVKFVCSEIRNKNKSIWGAVLKGLELKKKPGILPVWFSESWTIHKVVWNSEPKSNFLLQIFAKKFCLHPSWIVFLITKCSQLTYFLTHKSYWYKNRPQSVAALDHTWTSAKLGFARPPFFPVKNYVKLHEPNYS